MIKINEQTIPYQEGIIIRNLVDTYKQAITAKSTRDRLIKSGFPPEALVYWSPEEIEEWQKGFLAEVKQISF